MIMWLIEHPFGVVTKDAIAKVLLSADVKLAQNIFASKVKTWRSHRWFFDRTFDKEFIEISDFVKQE